MGKHVNGPTHEEAAATSRRAKHIAADFGTSIATYAMVMIIPGDTEGRGL